MPTAPTRVCRVTTGCVGCTGKAQETIKSVSRHGSMDSAREDVDECSLAENLCEETKTATNSRRLRLRVCPDGFEETEDACVPPEALKPQKKKARHSCPPTKTCNVLDLPLNSEGRPVEIVGPRM